MSTLARAQGVSRYQPEDAEALHAFQRETFGPEARQADPAYFHWLFEENPHREPAGIHFWLVRRQNAVVGQQGGVPFPLKVGAGTARASWAVDLMVAPAWRLRGVGPVLTETQAASADVVLALGISDPAYKAYQRAGWIDLGHIPIYLRPLDIRRCLEVIPEGGEWLRRLARLAAPIAEGAVPAARAMAAVAGTRLEPADAFDARADAVWIEAAPRYPVIA
ncbi:MAG TPA: GNAT family N-acetyltransferase, partial [Azospirillaceae bacterium]|nr:GNAT family N-acetyltransferase [Azospirillaceae bacterium]